MVAMSRYTLKNDKTHRFWASSDHPIRDLSRNSSDLFSKAKWSQPKRSEWEGRQSEQSAASLPALRAPNEREPKTNSPFQQKIPLYTGLRKRQLSLWSKSRSLSQSHVWSETERTSPLDFESRVVWDGQHDPVSRTKHSNSFPGSNTTVTHPLLRHKKKKKTQEWYNQLEQMNRQAISRKTEKVDDKTEDYKYSHLDMKRTSKYALPEIKEEEKRPVYVSRYHADCYDSDDDLDGSWTLPRIEAVLVSEGVQPGSIAQQIQKIKARKSREYDNERRMKLKHIMEQRRLEELMLAREATVLPGITKNPESSRAKDDIDMYFKDIERIRWLSNQQIERGLIKPGVPVPRIVLVSSKYPNALYLKEIVRDETILPIIYDYHTEVLSGLINEVKEKLREYQEGYQMRSMLWCCQGGPGHIYFLKKTLISKQRLQGAKHPALDAFMKEIGKIMSRVDPTKASVHILGCRCEGDDDETRSKFMEALEASVSPNVAHFEAINEFDERGKDVIDLYFRYNKFIRLKKSKTQ